MLAQSTHDAYHPAPLLSAQLGTTALALQTSEGVVLAVEKRVTSKLLVPSSIQKLVRLDAHIGCAMSGLVSDARTLVDHARLETQQHWFNYDERMAVESCVQSVCDLALQFGEAEMARPFGVSLLIGGVDAQQGPVLYHTDPSGTYTRYLAKAIGAGSEGAQTALNEHYNKSLTLKEAERIALQILKDVMEDKINSVNVELAVVPVDTGLFQVRTQQEIQDILPLLTDPINQA